MKYNLQDSFGITKQIKEWICLQDAPDKFIISRRKFFREYREDTMNSKRFSRIIRLISAVTILAFLLTGCFTVRLPFLDKKETVKETTEETERITPEYTENFDDFADEVFAAFVSMDQITLRSMVLDENKFGIEKALSSWGDFSEETSEEEWALIEQIYENLLEYDYDELSRGQRITYDMLKLFLGGELALKDGPDFYDPLNPYLGWHLYLAFNLDTYQIRDKDDLDVYMTLVKDIKPFVESMCDYVIKRSEAGMFMCDDHANTVIEDCESVIDSNGQDFIGGFEDRLEDFDFLSSKEKQEYAKNNKENVERYVIPSYELIVKTVKDRMGSGEEGFGLARYDGGKEYYERILERKTGTSMSVDALFEMLEETAVTNKEMYFQSSIMVDYTLLNDAFSAYDAPEKVIENNLREMKGRFPEIPDAPDDFYVVEKMPDSFARFAAGMYLMPQVDEPWENTFYLNESYTEGMDLYEVTSHECVPGHLYQTVYFLTSDNSNIPLRYLISNYGEGLGTQEGWTTYIEGVSYEMAGLPEAETEFVGYYYQAQYAWISLLDIGINYYGWTKNDAEAFFSGNGLDEFIPVSDELIEMVDAMPGMYLSYTVGRIEFQKMMDRAKATLGDQYSEIEFHRFYMEVGPSTFDILNREMDEWMKEYE